MPWEGNVAVDPTYVAVSWYPPPEEVGEGLDFAYRFPILGLEYDDGLLTEAPFTDIPLKPGRPYVRIYLTEQQCADIGFEIADYCEKRRWIHDTCRIKSEDWANAWKAYYMPQWFFEDYVIVPSWMTPSPVDSHHTIWLDPGMAFGTGTHATTRMCVNALITLGSLAGKRVMDLGAGSGILSLIAARRGAREVVAIEPDAVAREALKKNIAINGESVIQVIAGTLQEVSTDLFDVLCLNLIWEIIVAEWARLQHYVAPEGLLILSGLLPERALDIRRLTDNSAWDVLRIEENEGWLMVVVQRGSNRA